MTKSPPETQPWAITNTTDDAARGLYLRHYSSWKRHPRASNPRFVGPGQAMVCALPTYQAIFVWRLSLYRRDHQTGIECTVFRNESPLLSSELIRHADQLADLRWPGQRHYTFVDPALVRSRNPGYCFLRAGWRRCGRTARGLHILERPPAAGGAHP